MSHPAQMVFIPKDESSRDVSHNQIHIANPWKPTPKQFVEYKQREVELAQLEVSRRNALAARGKWEGLISLTRSTCLFSEQTIAAVSGPKK